MISLRQIAAAWNRFFFEPQSPTPIALYRILLGAILLVNLALILPHFTDWFGVRGTLTPATARVLSGGNGLNLLHWLPQTDAAAKAIFWLCFAASATLMLGLFTRTSALLVFLTLVSLNHRNTLIVNSGDSFLRIATFFLIFSQAGAAFSLDRLIRVARGRESGPAAPAAPWAMRMISLQLAFLYLYTFAWKAMGAAWLNGTALYFTSRLPEFWRFPTPYIFEHLWTIKAATWGTLLLELALGTLVWIKELRYWVLLGGILLHLGIDYTMNIPLFGPIMVAAYLTFVEPRDLDRAFSWGRGKWNALTGPRQPVPVFYDGKCSFCLRALAVVEQLDLFRRFQPVNMHEPGLNHRFPGFDPKRGQKEMMVLVHDQWLGGFSAFRYLARHMPLFWPLLPLLYLPMAEAVGHRIYSKVAGQRYCLLQTQK